MINLTSENSYNIKGRGLTITVDLNKQNLTSSIRIGDEVSIDNVAYKVNGIEKFSFSTYPPKNGNLVGLLVEEI